jgi:rhodanese-related sulfurtransferase
MGIKSVADMVKAANEEIKTYSIEEANQLVDESKALFVDIRDVRELQKLGKIVGAEHAPRGMLEFWVDPQSPYHKEFFAQSDKTYIFYCASAWRSALAAKAMQDMGMENVSHLEGGFSAWQSAEMPIEPLT